MLHFVYKSAASAASPLYKAKDTFFYINLLIVHCLLFIAHCYIFDSLPKVSWLNDVDPKLAFYLLEIFNIKSNKRLTDRYNSKLIVGDELLITATPASLFALTYKLHALVVTGFHRYGNCLYKPKQFHCYCWIEN